MNTSIDMNQQQLVQRDQGRFGHARELTKANCRQKKVKNNLCVWKISNVKKSVRRRQVTVKKST